VELRRDTPMEAAWQVWEPRPGEPAVTVVVKATYDLPEEGVATLADAQRMPTGDAFVEDDIERGVAYPSDLEPLKPRAEVLVVGHAHVPEAVPRTRAVLRLGGLEKSLSITGDRAWRGKADPAQPFSAMPLGWERSFGGPTDRRNPIGRGLVADPAVGAVLLPNLEDPSATFDGGETRPTPCNLGPIPRTWEARLRHGGTYDAAWLAERYPHPAADLDYQMFMAASPDQHFDGFLRGDEALNLVHLHPRFARVACTFPGHRAQAFFVARGGLLDVGLRLDTVVVDADQGQAMLVWRGVASLPEPPPEALFVVHQEPGDAHDRDAYEAWHRRVAGAEEEAAAAAEPEPVPTGPASLADILSARLGAGTAGPEEPGARWAHLDQAMTVQGDPDIVASVAQELARRRGEEAREKAFRPVFEDALGLPPARAPEAKAELDDGLTPEERLELEMELALGDLTPPEDPKRQAVREALEKGESCAGWDLTHVDLGGMSLAGGDFTGAILTRANLSGAVLRGTRLDEAVLTEAELSGAVFEDASLVDAVLSPVRAANTRFIGTDLSRSAARDSYFREARFVRCDLRGAELAESDLGEASFDECRLDGADLSGATLEGATFARSSLVDAWCEGVEADRLVLDGCDARLLRASEEASLKAASFRRSVLDGARFGGARLSGADFSLARLGRADFTEAFLDEAKLLGAFLRAARLDGAVLQRASMMKADLFQARLERADLRFADLRGANLFQAELLGAQLEEARFDLADLTGTRRA
jgi:uncharacterized protein YjbI with pentapeptide repeats